ncbi:MULTISPECIES: MFS transporter [Brevibacterium]|uniref:MFS transporter n=1 Tax=Brevibacterium sediminis TaxID=1857024 RepID=A0A5C4WTU6_9MICO|nr:MULTISPECIES: MFS transporter [Brevibacterium]TNM51637.1 MFS transporter [Brevibacterium sediminis]GGC35716.1 MFS transporter [Brevibacterium sediminis]
MTDTIAETKVPLQLKRRSVVASTIGNILEWYEWSAYAVFTPFIAAAMFNSEDTVSSVLATLGVFAVGFLMRPLGGIVFGKIADVKGRKFVLIVTMLIMAGGSFLIAVLPTYGQIGVFASLILLLIRVAQGFAHGGESATANSYIAEIAPAHKRGFWGSIVFVAIFGGSVVAYTIGGVITNVFSEAAVSDWAWRIPFALGGLLALVALWMRRGMVESDVFEADEAEEVVDPTPLDRGRVARAIVLVVLMTSGITAAHYTWTSYASTLAITERGMDAQTAYWATVGAQIIALASLPFWGFLSDRIGRRPVLIGFGVLMAILQYPLMGMITDTGWTLFVASTLALLVVSMAGALLSAVLSEAFPTKVRTQGIGFAYSVSVAVFGGTAPYLNGLFNSLDLSWLSSGWVVLLCLATIVAVVKLPETKGKDLNAI